MKNRTVLFLCFFFLTFFWFLRIFPEAATTVYLERDLHRAELLAHGAVFLFGPETTGGGNLWGPLYYFLLALPLKLGLGWKGAWMLMLALNAIAFAALADFLTIRFSLKTAGFTVASLLASFTIERNLLFFNNNSFLLPVAIFSLIFLCRSFEDSRERRRNFILFAFFSAIGLQIHFTTAVIFAAGILLSFLPGFFRLPALPQKALAAAVAIIGVFVSPYWLWRIAQTFGFQIGASPEVIIHSATGGALKYIEEKVSNPFATGFGYVKETIYIFPALLFVFAFFYVISYRSESEPRKNTLRVLNTVFFVSLFNLLFYVGVANVRYAVVPYLLVSVIAAIGFSHALNAPKRLLQLSIAAFVIGGFAFLFFPNPAFLPENALRFIPLFLALIAVIVTAKEKIRLFTAVLLLSLATLSIQNATNVDFHRMGTDAGIRVRAADATAFANDIFQTNGWSADEFLNRVFWIDANKDGSAKNIYAEIAKSHQESSRSSAWDGYFVVLVRELSEAAAVKEKFYGWINSRNLPNEIKASLRKGSLSLGAAKTAGYLVYAPYKIERRRRGATPLFFQNQGNPYLLRNFSGLPGFKRRFIGKINHCADHNPFCDAEISLAENKNRTIITVSGGSLSQRCAWVFPSFVEEWRRPYFAYLCGKEKRKIPLAEALGYDPALSEISRRTFAYNNSWLAPAAFQIELNCRMKITDLRFGIEGGAAHGVFPRKTTLFSATEVPMIPVSD